MPDPREGWQTQGHLTFSIFCVNSCEAALCGQSLLNAELALRANSQKSKITPLLCSSVVYSVALELQGHRF
jgi:L-aminopeptidase/D-esterase-like protein